ncbi:MAG: NUDIX domain-containing protein [Oscillospiraceae bacterium]|nr:NUDIX domain-containing protein [Oscillospiraceae bacterium]
MAELQDVLDEFGNKTGRLHERGTPMQPGEYRLAVEVWIVNGKGEFLISKRSPHVRASQNMWQPTTGAVIAGDDSLKTALKEAWEEIGVMLSPENGRLILRRVIDNMFLDVWIFHQEVDISDVMLDPKETVDAKWVDEDTIRQMIVNGEFILDDVDSFNILLKQGT